MKVRATETNTRWGYFKGDIIKITGVGASNNGVLLGKNISNELFKDHDVYIFNHEFELYEESPNYVIDSIKEYKLFGVTVFKKIKKVPVEAE